MKKVLACILVCLMLLPMGAMASNDVAVQINGVPVEFDVPAQIIGDRTMVPMRKIFETFKAQIEWFGETQVIMATRGSLIIVMQIGKPTMNVNDIFTGEAKEVTLDVPPAIVGDRTLVPVRAISESLGMDVQWDDVTRTVLITG